MPSTQVHARACAAWSGAALVVVLTSTNPVYRALVLLVAVNVLLGLRRRDAAIRPLLFAIGIATVLTVLLNIVLSHTGDHVVLTLPGALPGVGGPITVEAAVYGLDVALGIAAAVLAVAPLSRVLHAHDLLDAFPRALQRTAALTGSAINLVPGVARNAVAISEAQRMRGGSGTRLRDWHAVAAPVLLSALDDSTQLAEAMEARGFGNGRRSRYASAPIDRAAIVVIACSLGAIVVTVGARMSGLLPDWYPFPHVTVPDVGLLPLSGVALLLAPLVVWRRS
ncbi:MAG TPA: energy-coupling factor transporter transmembrane component T [Candidatus Dormibacteraeota bacterium]|nr:energy-coupling factor transporter transmembrane component T [Candidatus Dormibacteraeota bacterium]